MKQNLIELHNKLTEAYAEVLEAGCEDPRLLKEIREFLNDNNILVDNILEDTKSSEDNVIELDISSDLMKKYKVN